MSNDQIETLKAQAAKFDLDNLIRQGTEMADLLARVALREEHENPSLSVKAAQAASRAFSEGVTGAILSEQIKQLQRSVKEMLSERRSANPYALAEEGDTIGVDAEGIEVKRPYWASPQQKRKEDEKQGQGTTQSTRSGKQSAGGKDEDGW